MKIALSIIILTLFSSCVYDHTAAIEELGNGYYYLGDGHESQILFDPKQRSEKKVGLIVTGPEVIEYNFDTHYIIVKSIDQGEPKFWIIDKEMPLDSIKSFDKLDYQIKLEEKGILMELKERK